MSTDLLVPLKEVSGGRVTSGAARSSRLGGPEVVAAVPLLFSLLVLPWMFGGRSGGWLVAAQVLTFTALGALAAAGRLSLPAGRDHRLLVMILALLGLGAGVSAIFSANTGVSFPLFLQWLWLGASGLLAAMLGKRRVCRELLAGALMLAVFAQAFWSFYVWWGSQDPLHQQVGTFYAANQYAGYLLLLAPMFLAISLTSASRLKAAGAGFAAAYLYLAIALSGSRAGLVAAGCGLVAMVVMASRRRPGRRVLRTAVRTVLVVAAVAGLGLVMTSPLLFRSKPAGAGVQGVLAVKGADPASLVMRLRWDVAAVKMGIGHPLTGTGLGTYGPVLSRVQQPRWQWSKWAHNQYLEAFAEGGLLLLAGMIGLPLLGLVRGYRALRRGALDTNPFRLGLWAGLLGAAAHLLVDHDWSYPAYAVAFVIVAVLVLASWDGPDEPGLGVHRMRPGGAGRSSVAAAAGLCVLLVGGGVACNRLVHGRNGTNPGNLRLAMVLEPYAPAPYTRLAERSASMGGDRALADAAAALRSAIRRNRLDPSLRWELAAMSARIGDVGSARQADAAAIAMAPGNPTAYVVAAAYELNDAHDPGRAAAVLDGGIARLRAGGSPASQGLALLVDARAGIGSVGNGAP